jgi:hypothetical protein
MKRLLFAALAVLGYAGLAMAPSASSIATEPTATPFTIRSSLDGRAFLPHRIRWIAYASRPVLFPGVEFLIDGKVVFANRLVPYAFADDGRDEASGTRKTGYLVTSWLTPGPHAFTVRGKALVGGRRTTATKTVVARVDRAPAPLAQLAGTWQRTGDPDEGATCDPWGPEATYSWSVNDGVLTLAPAGRPDGCKQRGAIVTGDWTRVG